MPTRHNITRKLYVRYCLYLVLSFKKMPAMCEAVKVPPSGFGGEPSNDHNLATSSYVPC